MNDEVKLILTKLKIVSEAEEQGMYLCDKEHSKLLLDYITNLQEIAEEHKNCTRKHWQQKCAEHYANELIYKSRNEKAIEYIENDLKSFLYSIEYKTLLNILNGGDNN